MKDPFQAEILETFVLDAADSSYLVCAYFTESYREHAERLKSSLEQWKINYYIAKVSDQGYWEANTRIKPDFIRFCLAKFPNKNILYLDADAVVKNTLDRFEGVDEDVLAYHSAGLDGMSHDYLLSTIFFKNNVATKSLVEAWLTAQVSGAKTQVDQDSFDTVARALKSSVSIGKLEPGYIKIFDRDSADEIFIEQYQASRGTTKLRRKRIRQRNQALALFIMILLLIAVYFLFLR